MNFKRIDRKIIREIQQFREQCVKAGLEWEEILFLQVQKFKATAREHAEATYPLHKYSEHELSLKMWTLLKRLYNATGDPLKLIIGVAYSLETLDGKRRRYFFEELAVKGSAGIARRHQDVLNKGGIKKSEKLAVIENNPKLKTMHQKEMRKLLKRINKE
jgi:hypothetical protein